MKIHHLETVVKMYFQSQIVINLQKIKSLEQLRKGYSNLRENISEIIIRVI
jgi:hypothetical protein